jgi:hypothetical protein
MNVFIHIDSFRFTGNNFKSVHPAVYISKGYVILGPTQLIIKKKEISALMGCYAV